jgi:hypothetical protein
MNVSEIWFGSEANKSDFATCLKMEFFYNSINLDLLRSSSRPSVVQHFALWYLLSEFTLNFSVFCLVENNFHLKFYEPIWLTIL